MSKLIVVLFLSVQALSALAFECSNNTQLTEKGNTDFSAYGAVTCSWVITVSDKYIVELTIKRSRLGSSANPNCRNDYFQVRDGSNSTSTLLATICDLQPGSSEYRSNGSQLWVKYKSSNPNNEFQASFKRILNQRYCPSDVISNETGFVYSPFSPEDYPNDTDCSWNLIGPSGSHLILTFYWICLGICTSPPYYCDQLTISDVYITKFLHLQSSVEPSISRQNSIALSFVSDSEYTSKGFKAKYEVVFRDTACSQMIHLTNSSGWFASPNFPQDYPNGVECNWNISVPTGFKLFLTFLIFNTEECDPSSCSCDYVEIRSPPYTQAYAERKCGNYPSRDWTVTSLGSLLVSFKSDGHGSKQGFEAVYVLRPQDAYDSVPSAYCPLTYSPTTEPVLIAEDHADEPRTAIVRTAAVSVDTETDEPSSTSAISATSDLSTSSRNSGAHRSNIFFIPLHLMTVFAIFSVAL